MATNFLVTDDYKVFIDQIRHSIQHARNKVVRSANSELINLYFYIGGQIVEKQRNSNWGEDLIGQIELDLKTSFPNLSGFSRRNLNYMRNLYDFCGKDVKVQQLVAQIPWGHIIIIMTNIKDIKEAKFYIQKTIENSWSRVILDHQISLKLYQRQGKLINNFDATINIQDTTLIKESFKESYILDFLELGNEAKERDLEQALTQNITHFMLELGRGFAFVGKQYKLTVGGQEFFVDMLFYNFILKRFVIIELKTTEFKPEYAGQIGFYITAIDKDVKKNEDKETVGLIICRNKNKTVVEYALSNSSKPTGVAEYKLLSDLPEEIQKYLPTENELKSL
jgi:predicted nuclease of restriction endonuclease-like (RecB) superfamily